MDMERKTVKQVILRFMACSDLHYKNDPACREKKRFEEGLRQLYAYADSQPYKAVDAVYIVGDFTDQGTMEQMTLVKESLDRGIRPGTEAVLCMASHEYGGPGGQAGARERFGQIFGQDADTHRVIRGFHFIAVSTDEDCRFWEPQVSFAAGALEAAHEDDPRRAVFFFQHPHLTDTVYGSIVWGERDLNPTLYNYPQVIDFSGHSHVPINDPRSIHQDYVTSVGTGTFSYFEMDEFDKICGTFPPDAGEAAQMQIVEAFDDGSVLIKPWDVLTGQPFHEGWTVERPWDPASFVYTRPIRYRFAENQKPRFPEGAVLTAEQTEAGFRLTFDHAEKVMGSDGREEDVDDYVITVRDGDGILCRRFVIWSPYYLTRRPEKMSYDFPKLKKGVYTVAVKARGFWRNESEDCLEAELTVE